jgi:hypothetical protein
MLNMRVITGMIAMEINTARYPALRAGADLGLHIFMIIKPARETAIIWITRLKINSAVFVFVTSE